MNKNLLKRAFTAIILLLTGFLLLLINIGVISLEIKEMFVEYYPVLLLLFGLYIFLSNFAEQSGGKLFAGFFLITFSSLLLLSRFDYLEFKGKMIWKLWPLFIIFIGLKLLFKKNKNRLRQSYTENFEDKDRVEPSQFSLHDQDDFKSKLEDALEHFEKGKVKLEALSHVDLNIQQDKKAELGSILTGILGIDINQQVEDALGQMNKSKEILESLKTKKTLDNKPKIEVAIDLRKKKSMQNSNGKTTKMITIGSVEFNQSNWQLTPMKIYQGIGDYTFDFNKAYIPERETLIELKGWIGDVNIIVPEDIPIRVQAKVSIGDVTIFSTSSSHAFGPTIYFESPHYERAAKKIDFIIDLMIGEVSIDKV